jgi:hypothetical protein
VWAAALFLKGCVEMIRAMQSGIHLMREWNLSSLATTALATVNSVAASPLGPLVTLLLGAGLIYRHETRAHFDAQRGMPLGLDGPRGIVVPIPLDFIDEMERAFGAAAHYGWKAREDVGSVRWLEKEVDSAQFYFRRNESRIRDTDFRQFIDSFLALLQLYARQLQRAYGIIMQSDGKGSTAWADGIKMRDDAVREYWTASEERRKVITERFAEERLKRGRG